MGPVREFLKKWQFSEGPKGHDSFASTAQRGIKARQDELKDWRTKTTEWLGEEFDKQATIDEIRSLLTEANQLGLCDTGNIREVRHLLGQFRDIAIADALAHAALASHEQRDGTTLHALTYDFTEAIQVTGGLGVYLLQIFEDIEKSMSARLENGGAVAAQRMIDQVTKEFQAMQSVVNDYAEIRSYDGS
ncbi:MAG: hypothetical protein IH881_14305 [Myxococcales bacterium]|nr:hypothetical protein [Myxococcales bacterium]